MLFPEEKLKEMLTLLVKLPQKQKKTIKFCFEFVKKLSFVTDVCCSCSKLSRGGCFLLAFQKLDLKWMLKLVV